MNNNGQERQDVMRVLSLFERLIKGDIIHKKTEAFRFGVTERAIQRDIRKLKEFFANAHGQAIGAELVYSRKTNGFQLQRSFQSWLTHEEILVMTKVLLESRGFAKDEINNLLDKLLLQSAPQERSVIKEVIRNERFHYVPPKHSEYLIKKIWDLSRAVRERRLVELAYKKEGEDELISRVVEAWGIVFSEYYFYLVAYIHGKNYEFPAIYRLDRIQEYVVSDEHFTMLEANRFEEGEFRKRVQFMKAGKVLRIRFRFWGDSLDAVLDRLPTARVISQEDNGAIIEAEVFGRGINMWLLSQAEYLEVLWPEDVREEMKHTIERMLKNYK